MPRPLCFMIMPYSTKVTGAPAGTAAPDRVDFDRLWEAALRPAIDKAGYEPVRANEDIGALIISEMIERLAISDLVLADVSIPNGNVYYEVGIRHAAQRQGCVMTAATWKLETTLADCRTAAQLHEEPRRSELLDIIVQLEALLPTKAAAPKT